MKKRSCNFSKPALDKNEPLAEEDYIYLSDKLGYKESTIKGIWLYPSRRKYTFGKNLYSRMQEALAEQKDQKESSKSRRIQVLSTPSVDKNPIKLRKEAFEIIAKMIGITVPTIKSIWRYPSCRKSPSGQKHFEEMLKIIEYYKLDQDDTFENRPWMMQKQETKAADYDFYNFSYSGVNYIYK